ncbi:actin cytoskeleton-regulatory complex protein PAN1 isoform X4 [Drosophila grimshawi]|uniref:actin cytoskeleton-regulatory complex protein PAN1 isoform X4 n=1 Tax=Drosophila grimshawi TaxID=7222 RepID=UPI000C87002A|nr:actin cytoskeleton-regulatory complex protein PAN1 isoform X4 [Drosophila grimshawi]
MDFWGIFMFCLLTFLVMSCCGYCCTSKRRGTVLSTPVVVTSATHTAPGGYPVTQIPATTYQPNTYGTPYPAQTTGNVSVQQMPMPMPGVPMPGMQPNVVAYPPMPMPQPGAGAANMNPPTYDMAMANSGPSVMPGGYEKQSPYNPNYAQ